MKKYYLLFTFFSFFLAGFAQPLYQASNYADPGDDFTVTEVYAPQLVFHYGTITNHGANKNWDFRFMQGAIQTHRKFYNPINALDYAAAYIALCTSSCMATCPDQCEEDGDVCRAGCSGIFQSACIGFCDIQESLCTAACPVTCALQCTGNTLNWNLAEKRFIDIDFRPLIDFRMEDNYNIMGIGNNMTNWAIAGRVVTSLVPNLPPVGVPIIMPYTDPDDKIQFPITYGDQHTDRSSYGFDLAALGNVINVNTDLAYIVTQERTTEVVGYGTIKTPHGTYTNALKVRTQLHREFKVRINGLEVNTADWPDILDPIDQLEYLWFDASEEIPVFRVFGNVEFGIESLTRAEYLDNTFNWPFKAEPNNLFAEQSLVAGETFSANLYPNPFKQDFNLEFVSPEAGLAEIDVFNTLGQLVVQLKREVEKNEGVNLTIETTDAIKAKGIYTVRLRIGSENETTARLLKH